MSPENFPKKIEKEQSPELREFLRSFDFESLRSLFQSEAQKAGLEKPINMVVPNEMGERTNGMYGEYFPDDRSAALNLAGIKALAESTGMEWQVLAQKVLIHEEVHAITDHGIPPKNWAIQERQIGYEHSIGLKHTGIGPRLYFLWNEGVTEMWARKLLGEYLENTREKSKKEIDEILKKFNEETGGALQHSYEGEVNLVNVFISHIAKEVGVSEETVRTAVIHGLLRGESLSELEGEGLVDDMFPKNFIHDLERASYHNTVHRLKKELEKPDGTWIQSRFERRLQRGLEGFLEANSHR